jgi:hypothetical protein
MILWWWIPEAVANDCQRECFEIEAWEACQQGLAATVTSPTVVKVFLVTYDSQLTGWTLARNGEVLFEDRTFQKSEAVADYTGVGPYCDLNRGFGFVVYDDGLAPGTYLYTIENDVFSYEGEVTLEEEPGCGCGTVPLPGLVLGVTMLGAGAALTRRRG